MRKSGRCPKCNGDRIASFREGLVGEPPTELVRRRRQQKRVTDKHAAARDDAVASDLLAQLAELDRKIARLEEKYSYRRYVCGGCGYSEIYMNSPALLDDEEIVGHREIRWESGQRAGPYR